MQSNTLIYLDFYHFGCVIDGWYTGQFIWSIIHSSSNTLGIHAPRDTKQRKKALQAKNFRVASFESKILTIHARFVNSSSNNLPLCSWFLVLHFVNFNYFCFTPSTINIKLCFSKDGKNMKLMHLDWILKHLLE